MLSLTPENAKAVLYASEGKEPGPGHTLVRHVDITNEQLIQRSMTQTTAGMVHFFAAFHSIRDCVEALSLAAPALSTTEFSRRFPNDPNGRFEGLVTLARAFPMRNGIKGAKFQTDLFYLAAVKHDERPHLLHVITFYPTMRL
jgi:hypothetical protein